jgi:DNA phosphorothioation-dependent restriction protein DptG
LTEDLKKILLEIELSLKRDDLERARFLYNEIEKNWEIYVRSLDLEGARSALNLINFIESLLKEKIKVLKEEKDYLLTRRSYSKFI